MRMFNWYPLYAKSRFSERTVVHFILELDDAELTNPGASAIEFEKELHQRLLAGAVIEPGSELQFSYDRDDVWLGFAQLLAQLGLLFQRQCGHRVSYYHAESMPRAGQYRCVLEHEHCDVGMSASKLAWEAFTGQRMDLRESFRLLREFAERRLLPANTSALLAAAENRGIPIRKLDRLPLPDGEFGALIPGNRSIPNGLVTLGHGRHMVMLEGLDCLGPSRACSKIGSASENATTADKPAGGQADAMLDKLFPGGCDGTIPLYTITGTNGKTTTSRMLSHILTSNGLAPGLACSDGLYVAGKLLEKAERAALSGHLKILANDGIDCAILESHHRGIVQMGMPYQHSDISVCLNVTGDHLQTDFIETIEELALVKRSLLERASRACIVFADDDHCFGMIPFLKARHLCLVSLQQQHQDLQRLMDHQFDSVTMDTDQNIVLNFEDGKAEILINACDIPATMGGAARHNISNAMHALAASIYAGIEPASAAKSMQDFGLAAEDTPGRLNVHDNGVFRVVMDIAHNEDGFRKLVDYVSCQPETGRKMISFSVSGDRSEQLISAAMKELAGNFDYYELRAFRRKRTKTYDQLRAALKNALLSHGVDPASISVQTEFEGEVERFLSLGKKDDLMVYISGSPDIQYSWDHILKFVPRFTS